VGHLSATVFDILIHNRRADAEAPASSVTKLSYPGREDGGPPPEDGSGGRYLRRANFAGRTPPVLEIIIVDTFDRTTSVT
jgi:hypothetical protein